MTRAFAVLLLLVLLLAVYALMYAGWSRRGRRHPGAEIASAATTASESSDSPPPAVTGSGIYVSTVSGQSRLDRVTAAGLGVRSRADMVVDATGVRWEREGAATVHAPAERIVAVEMAAGMAGKFVGQPRLLMVTWRADDGSTYETGFLPRYRAEAEVLLAAVERIVQPAPTPTTDGAP